MHRGTDDHHPLRFITGRGYAMIRSWMFLLLTGCATSALAQNSSLTVAVDPSADTARISPYMYGTNGQSNDRGLNITARCLGANRMT